LRFALIAEGRLREPFIAVQAHYLKMIGNRVRLEVVEVRKPSEILRRSAPSEHVVALDPAGAEMTTGDWVDWLVRRRLEARDTALLIGGPQGLPPEALSRADQRLSLGKQTMAHQLARVVLLEQIFRAVKIEAGEPYHL
jgi:23S rRNA (pseudouridine1915-N3)-methyltransferase